MKKKKHNVILPLGLTFIIALTIISFEELFVVQPKINTLNYALIDASNAVKVNGEYGVGFAKEKLVKATNTVGMSQTAVKVAESPYNYTLEIDGVFEATTLTRKLIGKTEIKYNLSESVNSDIR